MFIYGMIVVEKVNIRWHKKEIDWKLLIDVYY